jgi:hypothetical protein
MDHKTTVSQIQGSLHAADAGPNDHYGAYLLRS